MTRPYHPLPFYHRSSIWRNSHKRRIADYKCFKEEFASFS